ncbi:MAG: DUF58 domain-containing protein [Chthoniobacteraceae bacterium]|nr:DUF58 domain-containing protein [Chthoniobacteraceae bacterium]
MASEHQLLDPVAIHKAEVLGLQARQIVEGYMAGEHKSPYRGFAIEFSQHREYVPGDDTRHLDWKVLGRCDRYYIKQYEQETNYVAHLLVDGSESMRYGSGKITKFDYAKTIAACLAYLILQQRDAVALALFDTTTRNYLPRTDSLSSIHNLMTVLSGFVPEQTTQIANVLHEMAGQVKRKGIFIIISDCFDDVDEVLQGMRHLQFSGSEVILFHVMDPAELTFPFKGSVEFRGLEGTGKLVTRPSELRKSYLREINGFINKLRSGCETSGCNYIPVNTAQPWHEVLCGYLATRQHRYG